MVARGARDALKDNSDTREVIVKRALVDIDRMGPVRTGRVGVRPSQLGLPRFPAKPSVGAFRLHHVGAITSSPANTGGLYEHSQASVPELRKRQAEAACQRP